jgi:hypothetical protein
MGVTRGLQDPLSSRGQRRYDTTLRKGDEAAPDAIGLGVRTVVCPFPARALARPAMRRLNDQFLSGGRSLCFVQTGRQRSNFWLGAVMQTQIARLVRSDAR